jgi:hypothetical protein
MNAKSQVASLDLIISAIILLVFLALIIVLVPFVTDQNRARTIYGGEVFTAIENMPASFLTNYRIDEVRLAAFRLLPSSTIENTVIGDTTSFDTYTSDVCIFFLKNGITPVEIVTGVDTIGTMVGGCTTATPCGTDYHTTYVHAKPVLRNDEIVTMYVVVCKE